MSRIEILLQTKGDNKPAETKQLVTVTEPKSNPVSSDSTKSRGRKKVVKVTRTVTRKVIPGGTGEMDPELQKVFHSRLKKIENAGDSGDSTKNESELSKTNSTISYSTQISNRQPSGLGSEPENKESFTKQAELSADPADKLVSTDRNPLPVSNIDDVLSAEDDFGIAETVKNTALAADVTSPVSLTVDKLQGSSSPRSPAADESGFLSASSDTDTTSSSTAAGSLYQTPNTIYLGLS